MTASFTTDCNLLFGVLALQMDFITRDQLIAAMQAWVFDKSQSLGAILVQQNVITSERYVVLQALVEEHLKHHHDDPQQSLATVYTAGFVRQDLAKIADAEVQSSLGYVPAFPPRNDDPYPTLCGAVGTPTSTGLRFRIIHSHAEGGLGKVFVAYDEELHREVALKEIKDRHADNPESRARFLLEAEITGGLEHPGIVPVYGLGAYEDGRPFYAMRFIKGSSMKDAIDNFHAADMPGRDPGERALTLRKLLGRFIDVCQAMQYAHDRGVLHRDLKPSNIMLGKYGETLVVDWGLAKLLGKREQASEETVLKPATTTGSSVTLVGSALGTPQYMSPEQATGCLDQLSPASDVYSLGATLYTLLTGRASIEDSTVAEQKQAVLTKLLKKVQQGDFPRPRQLKPGVDPALEAICLKAMALKPAQRYASPRALADDLEHWLADKPISAWLEPWTAQTRRWVLQHRAGMSVAAVALLVGLLSLLATVPVAALLTGLVGLLVLAVLRGESKTRLAAETDKVKIVDDNWHGSTPP